MSGDKMSREEKMAINRKLVLDSLEDAYYNPFRDYPVHREDIQITTRLARSTVYDILLKLELKEVVERISVKLKPGTSGRPTVYWKLCSLE